MKISNKLRKIVDPNDECCCEHCLGSKCKEYVSNITSVGYGYSSYYIHSSNGDSSWGHLERTPRAWIQDSKTDKPVTEGFIADTEAEATFLATQWVIDNKDNNDK